MITEKEKDSFRKGVTKKITVNGRTRPYQTYYVPLEKLFFNDRNGRIATFIQRIESDEKKKQDFEKLRSDGNKDAFNDRIFRYVKDSADDKGASFNATKEDIKKKGQREPGVILYDGRVIDGNRRFSCLRELYKETGDSKFGYFECAILKVPESEREKKEIKRLELDLQFNVDEKVPYNRIDFLVSFYNDTRKKEKNGILDKQSYCNAAGRTPGDYDKNVRIVNVMLDYLEWRGIPEAFYVLKEEKLDGPIEDIAGKRKKFSDEEWNRKKETFYNCITLSKEGDRTRNIRDLMSSAVHDGPLYRRRESTIDDPSFDERKRKALAFCSKSADTAEETKEKAIISARIQNSLGRAYLEGKYEESKAEKNDEPGNQLDKCLNDLNGINRILTENLSSEEKDKLKARIQDIRMVLDSLEDSLRHE